MTTITTLSADPFLLELTTSATQAPPACDCVGSMTYHGAEIHCTSHSQCQQDTNLYRICLGCMKRYCAPCFNDVHQNPLLNGCHTISWLSYTNAHQMYQRFGTPNEQNSLTMTLDTIIREHKNFFKKPRAAKHCRQTMRTLNEKYGGKYQLTFLQFLRQYTESTALFFTPVDVSETRRFHSLGACGRYWFSCYKRGSNSVNFLCFGRMLRRVKTDQGENVGTVMAMMYHTLLLNIFGLIIFGLMLLLPWALSPTTRAAATSTFSNFDWVGLATGIGIDSLPVGFGGYPDPKYAPTQNSLGHFDVLLPIFVFLIFAIATIYTFHLILNNRQSLSETVSSPALLGNVSTTAFTMFEHNLTNSASNTKQATQNYEANIRMSLIKKFNPDQKQSILQKFTSRNIFVMILSLLFIMGSAAGVFFIDYYGLSDRYGQKYLSIGINLQQLIFPAIFWIIRYLVERISTWFVKIEVPKRLHLYNRFRSVLFYRLSFLNVCFLASLIVITYFHQNDTTPLHQAINVQRQVDLGYCTSVELCSCPAQTIGMFWYRILVTGFYFEFIMIFLSIIHAMITRCFKSKETTPFFFSPIPRLSQFYFTQSLVWASILYLPASPIIGFLTMFFGWFFSYFKIQVLKFKPEGGVYLLPSKIQFYYTFVGLIVCSYVPSAILFTQKPNCGAFVESGTRNLTTFGIFTDATTDFPVVVKEIFSYATNPLVLWLIIITAITAIIALSHVAHLTKKERNKLLTRLKLESHERALLIKRLGVDYADEDHRGEELFIQWMTKTLNQQLIANGVSAPFSSNAMLQSYMKRIYRKHPNFIQLSKHSEAQLLNVFNDCGCPSHISQYLVESFMEFLRNYRNQVILAQQRTI